MADCNTCSQYMSVEDILRRSIKCDANGNVAIQGGLLNQIDLLRDKFLFLGYTSKISGGKLPNEVGTDWLNVIGTSYQVPTVLGVEMVTNNLFNDNTFWSLYQVIISNGSAVWNNALGYRGIYKTGLLTIGKTYQITYEIKEYASGGFFIKDTGTKTGIIRNANGVYTELFTASSSDLLLYSTVDNSTFKIDNVYCKEVIPVASYILADTENLWYADDDFTNRLVTTDELITFDWQRTIVKYANESPYTISVIAILKADVTLTTTEENILRDAFDLSVWWDGTLSAYGNVKANRGLQQNNGTELVINGEFTTSTGWTTATGYTFKNNALIINTAVSSSAYKVLNPNVLTTGNTFVVTFEIKEYTSGGVQFRLNWNSIGSVGVLRSEVGIFQEIVTIGSSGSAPGQISITTGDAGFNGMVDKFSIRKI